MATRRRSTTVMVRPLPGFLFPTGSWSPPTSRATSLRPSVGRARIGSGGCSTDSIATATPSTRSPPPVTRSSKKPPQASSGARRTTWPRTRPTGSRLPVRTPYGVSATWTTIGARARDGGSHDASCICSGSPSGPSSRSDPVPNLSSRGSPEPEASAVGHRLRRRWPDVACGRADQPVVGSLLEDVGRPTDGAADGEGGSEQLAGDAAGVHHDSGEELDVRVELATGLELRQHIDGGLFDLLGEVDQRSSQRTGRRPEECGTRVLGLVDAVAETHDPVPSGDRVADPRLGTLRSADAVEHVERPARRASVQRAGERTDRTADRRGQVGAGRSDDSCGEG